VIPKQAPINAFLLCLLPFAADVQTSPAQVHGAKVINYFGLSKRSANKNAIYAKILHKWQGIEKWGEPI